MVLWTCWLCLSFSPQLLVHNMAHVCVHCILFVTTYSWNQPTFNQNHYYYSNYNANQVRQHIWGLSINCLTLASTQALHSRNIMPAIISQSPIFCCKGGKSRIDKLVRSQIEIRLDDNAEESQSQVAFWTQVYLVSTMASPLRANASTLFDCCLVCITIMVCMHTNTLLFFIFFHYCFDCHC